MAASLSSRHAGTAPSKDLRNDSRLRGALISQIDADESGDGLRSTLKIVILVWNAHAMAMPRWGQAKFLADLHERLRDPTMPAETVDAIRTLSQRRLERFATDARAVGEWSLVMDSGQWRLRCDARAPRGAD